MSLRLRLIVAFFLLSVVPLAAVTLYTYTSNLQAVREAAGHEAEALAGELSGRMQVVTAQLGQGVERLMNLSGGEVAVTPATSQIAATRATQPAAAAKTATPTARAATGTTIAVNQPTDALGNLALLLDNIEIRGLRGRGGRGNGRPPGVPGGDRNGGPPRGGTAPAQALPAESGATAQTVGQQSVSSTSNASVNAQTEGRGSVTQAGAPSVPGPSDAQQSLRGAANGRRGDVPRFQAARSGAAPDGSAPPAPPEFATRGDDPAQARPQVDDDPTRLRIDMAPVRREVMQQFVPDGNLDSLTPEERGRVFDAVNQRMIGIQQGIQMLQERVAERVADARAQGGAATDSADAPTATAQPSVQTVPVPTATPAPVTDVVPASSQRRTTAISGSRLAVRVERNGEVVGQADADINIPNLLATVFTTTSRERGEVPFAVAKDGRLYAPSDEDRATVEALGSSALRADTPAGTSIGDDWVIATTADPTGSELKFGIARPIGDALADLRRTTALNAAFGLGLIALALIGIVPLSSRLTRNLERLNEGVNRIAQGDYGARVAVSSRDEVGQLAAAFNQMAADVEAHHRAALGQERLRRELELGRQIQHDMLPQSPLRLGLTEVKGVSVPAREVGGDFFNYFQLANGTVALLVGDVSGKGVGAALLMANIQASLRTRLALGQDLAALANELDRDIESSTPGPVYATLFVGIFDPATRLLRCVNAGHNPQYVIRRDGSLERMEATGLPIGLLAGQGYVEQRVDLRPGDLLFFYTDGCVEAENASGDMFGMDRLEQVLTSSVETDDVLATVEQAITRFRAGVELSDDATMMVVKVG